MDDEMPDWLEAYVKDIRDMLGGREPKAKTIDLVKRTHHFLCRLSITKIPLVQLATLAAVNESLDIPWKHTERTIDLTPKKAKGSKKNSKKKQEAPEPEVTPPKLVNPFEPGQPVLAPMAGVPVAGVFQKALPHDKALVRVNGRDISVPLESVAAKDDG